VLLEGTLAVSAWLLGLERPPIALDYIVLWGAALMVPRRRVSALVLMLLFAADFLLFGSLQLRTLDMAAVLVAAQSFLSDAAVRAWGLALGAASAALAILCTRPVRRAGVLPWRDYLLVSVIALGATAADRAVDVANPMRERARARQLTASAVWSLARVALQVDHSTPPPVPLAPGMRGLDYVLLSPEWRAAIARDERPNLVVLIVESWGLPVHGPSLEAERRRVAARLQRTHVIGAGVVPSHGFTLEAEMREWCGVRAMTAAPVLERRLDCVPNDLAHLGYETVAAHGALGSNYGRDLWWRDAGFEHVMFLDPRRVPGGGCFNAYFQTECDRTVLAELANRVHRDTQPVLAYQLTVDAHVPLAEISDAARHAGCLALAERAWRRRCAWHANATATFADAESLVERLHGSTWLLIVGDHPPQYDGDDYVPSVVPFIVAAPQHARMARPK
jgi:hypothetical protein